MLSSACPPPADGCAEQSTPECPVAAGNPRELDAAIALAARGDALVDIAERADADAPVERGGELPFSDRAVASISLGDAVAAWSVRDRLQLLLECRRVLARGATLRLVESGAAATFEALDRWAALVGFVPLPDAAGERGWRKRCGSHGQRPLVSILVPAWNPRYFLESLDSAIGQTYPSVEIIVCDDSEGGAIGELAATRAKRADIRYEKNATRLRSRTNYERLLALARGEYVKFLNDDDLLEPHCVERMVQAFEEVPDLTLATSHRLPIDAASMPLADIPATCPVVAEDVIVSGVSLANAMIMHGLNFVGEPSTMMFRRSDFDGDAGVAGAGKFHFAGAQVIGAIDMAMACRVLVQGNAVFFNARLSRFRRHGEQLQARPDVVAKSIAGIRELQHHWVELGLFRRVPPGLLEVRPFPDIGRDGEDWQLWRWGPGPRSAQSMEVEVRAWRNVVRHPFDFVG
jgi:glycosyltransferase involved in cell wall biosynthesis